MARLKYRQRGGFTLVEMLVVIAIIVILMSLTLTVVGRIWRKLEDSRTVFEINKMQEGLEQLKAVCGSYPPGRLLLCESAAGWNACLSGDPRLAQVAQESMDFLQNKLFPGIELLNPAITHDWTGRAQVGATAVNAGMIPGGNGVYLLEGQEVLVYLLGGMRIGNVLDWDDVNQVAARSGPLGFSSNKQRPCACPPLVTLTRVGPFMEFDESRRIRYQRSEAAGQRGNSFDQPGGVAGFNSGGFFPVYLDPYGTPYLYFRAYNVNGGVNNYRFLGSPHLPPSGNPLFLLECSRQLTQLGSANFVPYWQSVTPPQGAVNPIPGPLSSAAKYYRPERFQIISAGRDGLYGLGGRYDPQNPVSFLVNEADFDNLTNFTEGMIKP